MKRRSTSEIQSSYKEPSYLHQAVYISCEDDDYHSSSTVDILYNDKYEWGDLDEYHRDNYCSLPCVMPNMTLSGTVYPLDPKIVYSSVPEVSTFFGYTYSPYSSDISDSSDSSEVLRWNGLNLAKLVHEAYPAFSEKLSISVCVCSGSKDNPGHVSKPPKGFPSGPIDTFIPEIEYIADGYSHMWEDFWDMSTLNNPFPVDSYTPSPGPGPEPEPETPSTEYNNYVFIGALTNAPNGGSGTAQVIEVDSNGAWGPAGKEIQVICLKLN